MPKDSIFDDCHVINAVYFKDYKKWLWIDPTNDAYVMNEKGELLTIEEVRELLTSNKPPILNPEANWNNKATVTKEDYLFRYMAKNLYRLECSIESKYDYETWMKGKQVKYVQLLSVNSAHFNDEMQTTTNSKTGVTFVQYFTSNPNLFWAEPQR